MKYRIQTLTAIAALLALSGTAQATLFDRGGGMIYDDELDITWLQDWNQASVGDWQTANTWADTLVWGGFSDWRLPTMVDTGAPGCDFSNAGGTDCGSNVQTKSGATVYSEMAHLWYGTLGNKGYCPPGGATCASAQAGWGLVNTGPFTNMQTFAYWSGKESATELFASWLFDTGFGVQYPFNKGSLAFAVAVRPGDVVAAVPEPQTYALLMMGVGAVMLAVRRRPR